MRFPRELASKANMQLFDMSKNIPLSNMMPVIDKLIAYASTEEGAATSSTIFRKDKVADPFRSQVPIDRSIVHDDVSYGDLGDMADAWTQWMYMQLTSIDGWAPDVGDWRNGRVYSTSIHTLVRNGHEEQYDKTAHQAAHCDCPREGFGPHLGKQKWAGALGVNADSCIATGSTASKIWIMIDGDWVLLHLPPYHVLMFPGNAIHAGADFLLDNHVVHWYIGGADLMEAFKVHGNDLFDTTSFDYDTAKANSGFPSTKSDASLRQQRLDRYMPEHAARADELKRAAASPHSEAKSRASEDIAADASGTKRQRIATSTSPELHDARTDAFKRQQLQATRMAKRVAAAEGQPEVGSLVTLDVSLYERAKLHPSFIALVILKIEGGNKWNKGKRDPRYRIGNTHGVLETSYHHGAFKLDNSMSADALRESAAVGMFNAGELSTMPLTQLVRESSVTGAHGIRSKCGCKKGTCSTNNCACFKAGTPCHSGCHGKGGNASCKNDDSHY
jgi:hypothetical protein